MSALALLYLIGAYATALGVFPVWGAFAAPLDREDAGDLMIDLQRRSLFVAGERVSLTPSTWPLTR